jgi:hypothetical protein
VLKRYENNEITCDIIRVTGLNDAMLRTIRANGAYIRARYARATPLGVSRSSQARPTNTQIMERRHVTWIENQVKRNSSANM